LTDEYALNVTYRYDRGEPRESLKHATLLRRRGSRREIASTAANASPFVRPASISATAPRLAASNADYASTHATA